MDMNTPIIFADGTQFFRLLQKKYVKHSRGRFILAPSGSGKTYFVTRQPVKHWIDGDDLWPLANADLTNDEWENDLSVVMEANNRSDIITHQAIKLGLWVIGSSNHWLKPDAIVLPNWQTHKRYILKREKNDYSGGGTAANIQGVLAHRKSIRQWTSKHDVPLFTTVEAATEYFEQIEASQAKTASYLT